jgi:septal ring factor EnvC (AmiA/AmiB activator)
MAKRSDVRKPEHASSCSAAGGALAFLCLFYLAFLHPSYAADPPPKDTLKSIERALDEGKQAQARYAREAEDLAGQLATLREASIKAAEAVQQRETALSRIEEQLADLAVEEKTKSAELHRRSEQYDQLLMALQTLARHPSETLALSAGEPIDALRSALLLGAAVPQLEAKARALQQELAGLSDLRDRISQKRGELVAESAALEKEHAAVMAAIAQKASLQEQATRGAAATGERLQALSSEASDLRDLLDRLEAERRRAAEEQRRDAALLARATTRPPRAAVNPDAAPSVAFSADPSRPKGLRPFSAAYGTMVVPVSGKINRRFGENDAFGTTSKGIVLAARPGGQVVAPFDGRVEFAGPFRGYGQILIIEHGDGYHSLLAGLGRIEGVVGQWLVAGEPVGVMPTGDRGAGLYLELRHHGQPINPLPWLATREDKVSG